MTFAEAFVVLVVALSALIALPCWWMIVSVIAPKMHRDTTEICTQSLFGSTALGVVLVALLAYLSTTVFLEPSIPVATQLTTGLVVLIFFLLSQLGVSGLAARLGELSREEQPRQQLLFGCKVLAVSFVFPLIGWFVVFGLALSAGLGSTLIALFGRLRQ